MVKCAEENGRPILWQYIIRLELKIPQRQRNGAMDTHYRQQRQQQKHNNHVTKSTQTTTTTTQRNTM